MILVFYLGFIVKMSWLLVKMFVCLLEILGVICILKFLCYWEGMKIFVLIVVLGVWDLGFLVMFVLIVVILGFSVVFFVELNENEDSDFESILDVFWWVIIIICIVGYGDKVFVIIMGKFLGVICVVFGIVIVVFFLFCFVVYFCVKIENFNYI